MAPIQYPLVNGIRQDWNSISVDLGAGVELGITAINYNWTLDGQPVYGAHPQPLGDTLGQYKPEANIEMLLAEYYLLIARLGKGFALKRFTITVCYEAPGMPLVTDKIYGCRIKKPSHDNARGSDALVKKIDLMPLFITENGWSPIPKPLGIS
jgi:hypothetical protein